MNSMTTPLLCDNIQNKNSLTSGAFELPELRYSPPRLDMFGDMPPPTYKDAEDMVVCIGKPVDTKEHESSSTNKDNDDDTEEESEEEEEDDPIVIVEHKVQKNDTLQGLALRYHTSVRCPHV